MAHKVSPHFSTQGRADHKQTFFKTFFLSINKFVTTIDRKKVGLYKNVLKIIKQHDIQ